MLVRMRRRLAGVAALTLVALLGACSDSPTSTDASTSGPASDSGAFPATVPTKFGDVTITKKPTRVVALGWGDAETALGLGVQPVGASDWLGFGKEVNGVGPWAQGRYTTPPTLIDTMEPSFEAIGALQPDLILDVKGSGDKARYEALKAITPNVISVPRGGDNYLTDQAVQVEMIATALGVPDKGKTLLADIERKFAAVAAANPSWKGKTVSAATRTSEGWGAYVKGAERVAFLERLGFVQNPRVAALPTSETGFSVQISSEQLDVLDADLIVAFPIFIESTQISNDPLFQRIPAVKAKHSLVIDGDLAAAYSLGSVLSTTYAIDQLAPKIKTAVG